MKIELDSNLADFRVSQVKNGWVIHCSHGNQDHGVRIAETTDTLTRLIALWASGKKQWMESVTDWSERQ